MVDIRTTVAIGLAAGGLLMPSPFGLPSLAASESTGTVLLEGIVVTMNAARDVIHGGRVLVRNGRIAAIWQGEKAPEGIDVTDAVRAPLRPDSYIYPGLINLHDHPFYDVLPLWQPPSSHRQPTAGRSLGTEPYANRYQWNTGPSPAPELARLVSNPSSLLTASIGLGRLTDVLKFGRARMILGGTTATQGGGSSPAYDSLLARNVESANFGRQRILSRVAPIASLDAADASTLSAAMADGLVDAWLVHLAEGVRDTDRRPGDATSSRAEFAALKTHGLLTDATVIVHGVGLESEDFHEMAQAGPALTQVAGNRYGAKLVWSPLSNLLLYGRTTAVYEALAAGVLVSLGTDWTPSGSANLLTELKVADRALRDRSLLGDHRHLVPALTAGQSDQDHGGAERALDRLLVEMVTINPAMAVRWHDQVGSIDVGKVADLLVVHGTPPRAHAGIPDSPYRRLIDATEQNVELVMVGGIAQAGAPAVMSALKHGDYEIVRSDLGCFEKAIDITSSSVPQGMDTLAQVSARLANDLRALGGDHAPAGGGPSSPFTNTWSYLKARIPGASALSDLTFNFFLISFFGTTSAGDINLEAIALPPLFTIDDHWWFSTLEAARDDTTGLSADLLPHYAAYPFNANQLTTAGNPPAPRLSRDRWYSSPCARP